MLMGVVNKHAPIRETRIGKKRSPWITPNILQKMRTRDYLKKKFETTKDILTWNLYKKARNELNNILKQSKRAYFRTNLDSAKNNPKKTWNLINQLSSRNLNKCSNVNTVEFNGVEITDRHEVAEAFNTHFTEIGENLANNIPKTDVNPTSYIKPTNSVFSFKMTDVNYVKDLLREINTKKSSGPDNIPSKLLKIAMNVVAPSLTHIFNKSLCTSIYPKDWKMANVTPIYKNGAKCDLNNYRPISVISVVAKVFERIIHDQFYHYLTSNELLTNCQSGFRAKHSTVTSLLETTNKWSINIDNGLLNGVVFIDLKKAFDTIDHAILLDKLTHYGADDNTLRWFQSYLSGRTQRCCVNGHLSSSRPIKYGVPQGSIIGPLLFLVYINDLPNCLNNGLPSMYADDTNISFQSSNLTDLEDNMNNELSSLNSWLIANRLSLNIAKTEFMIIGSRQRLINHDVSNLNICVNNTQIKRVQHTKSLGLTIDENLTWKNHVDVICKKVSSGIGALKRVRRFMCRETAEKAYRGLLEPYFNYCCPVWDGIGSQSSSKLQKLQNRAARMIAECAYEISSSSLLEELNWYKLSLNRKKHKAILMYKTINKSVPQYLQDLFSLRSCPYSLRDNENKLFVPKPRTDYLKRSFSYDGAVLWNSLPTQLRSAQSLSVFKRGLNNWLASTDSHTAIM